MSKTENVKRTNSVFSAVGSLGRATTSIVDTIGASAPELVSTTIAGATASAGAMANLAIAVKGYSRELAFDGINEGARASKDYAKMRGITEEEAELLVF